MPRHKETFAESLPVLPAPLSAPDSPSSPAVSPFSLASSVLLLAVLIAGCGGGSTQPTPVPSVATPAAADFSITVSAASVSLPQGGVSAPITVTIGAKNGFASSVQLTLANLPAFVASNPTGTIAIAPGANASIVFGAGTTASPGNFTVAAQAVSGSLSHSASFTLAVQTSALAGLPRTTYARTDATSAADAPPGEPHHRHLVYDPANQHLFVANRAMEPPRSVLHHRRTAVRTHRRQRRADRCSRRQQRRHFAGRRHHLGRHRHSASRGH